MSRRKSAAGSAGRETLRRREPRGERAARALG